MLLKRVLYLKTVILSYRVTHFFNFPPHLYGIFPLVTLAFGIKGLALPVLRLGCAIV